MLGPSAGTVWLNFWPDRWDRCMLANKQSYYPLKILNKHCREIIFICKAGNTGLHDQDCFNVHYLVNGTFVTLVPRQQTIVHMTTFKA